MAAGSRKSSDFDFEGSGNVFALIVAKPSAKKKLLLNVNRFVIDSC